MIIGVFDKKKFTILGIILLTAGLILTLILVQSGTFIDIKAGPGQNPKKAEISNVSDSSFTVTYFTDKKVPGTLNFGTDQDSLDQLVLDDRDQISQSVNQYKNHSITVQNLNPETIYYFTITSGDKTYSDGNPTMNVKTGKNIFSNPLPEPPLTGRVVLANGDPASEAIVNINIQNAQKLSTYTKDDGNYTIPLNTLRNEDLGKYFNLNSDTIISIEIDSSNQTSVINVSKNQISPVPKVTLINSKSHRNTLQPVEKTKQKQTPLEVSNPSKNFDSSTNPSAIMAIVDGISGMFSDIFTPRTTNKQDSL